MAYTISYLYNRFLDKIDKSGSDIYSVDQFMELLEESTYDFIDEKFKYNENTQVIRDYLLSLYKNFSISITDVNGKRLAVLPNEYLHLDSVGLTDPTTNIRRVKFIRKGEREVNRNNPGKKPTPEYPFIIQYTNTLEVLGNDTATEITGFILEKPVFGDPTGDINQEICVNLPDNTVQLILQKMVRQVFSQQGDQRYQSAAIEDIGATENTK